MIKKAYSAEVLSRKLQPNECNIGPLSSSFNFLETFSSRFEEAFLFTSDMTLARIGMRMTE